MNKLIRSIKGILIGLYRSLKRFPITILSSAAVAVTLIVISEMGSGLRPDAAENLHKLALIFALAIPLSLCLKLLFERKNNGKKSLLALYYVVGAVFLIIYYFFFLKGSGMVLVTRYIGTSLAFYLAFLFIPYLPKREGYEMYIIKIFSGFFITVIYSAVLYLGLAAILFTVDSLLGIDVSSKVYYYTWLFVAFVFGASYFLAGIPQKHQMFTIQSYPKILKILLLYIVMPLLSVYTGILYIYFGKILITRQWPVGLVSHLVLWYSVVAAVVLFFITPVRVQNKWANTFYNLFPKIIIPILIMMFISIGIRVNAYGVTENRYYVIALGLWVLGIMIYLSLEKNSLSIILPVTLSIVALVAVYGPISSYSISKLSQNNRLKAILLQNNMLQDGVVKAASSDIPADDKEEISSILDYFNNNHSLKDVKYLPKDFKIEDFENVFGFEYQISTNPNLNSVYFFYTADSPQNMVDISRYDYMFDSRGQYSTNKQTQSTLEAAYNDGIVNINYNGTVVYSNTLQSYVKSLVDRYGINDKSTIPSEEMMLVDENEKVMVKFIFNSISGTRNASTGVVDDINLEFYMFVKIK